MNTRSAMPQQLEGAAMKKPKPKGPKMGLMKCSCKGKGTCPMCKMKAKRY